MPRFNYTGRKKINRRDVVITIFNNNGILSFNADISLNNYRLPADASIFVEAYRQTRWMRFPCGTVIQPEAQNSNRLIEFDSTDGILFRVKITKGDETHGKLLAIADRIQPVKPEEGDANRLCILPIKSEAMDCIWKVDFSGNYPILLISKQAGSKDAISMSADFISLVYPAVLREILGRLVESSADDMEEEGSWQNQWLKFVKELPGVSDPPEFSPEERLCCNEWIDDAVASFSRKLKILDNFITYWRDRE